MPSNERKALNGQNRLLKRKVNSLTSLKLDDHFIKRPAATFFVTVEGGGMAEHGILASDTLIVDGSAFNHALAHQARIVLIEKAGPGLQLVQDLRNDPAHGFPRRMGIVPEGDRWMRMEAQTPRFEAGHVLLPEEAAWLADFLSFFGTISVIANIATCELFSLRGGFPPTTWPRQRPWPTPEVPRGTYSRLLETRRLRLAHGLRVQPPAALMAAVIET